MPSVSEKLAGYLSDNEMLSVKSIYQTHNAFSLMNHLEEIELPLRSRISNRLINELCSIDDYAHAEEV